MPKYQKIAEEIQKGIKSEAYPEGFIPSEGNLCKNFGVSRITVRKALKVLDEQGVLESVPGKGWKISEKNNLHAKKHVKNVACVCCSQLPAYGIALNSLRENAEKAGYQASMLFINNSGIKHFKHELSEDKYCGIICIGQLASDFHEELEKSGLPVICVGYHQPGAHDIISVDDYTGGWMAAQHLLSSGHKRFIIINNKQEAHSEFKIRENGFVSALNKDCEFISCDTPDFNGMFKSFSPDAIFITTDLHASIILTTLEKNKINIPKDISITGYDNFVNNTAPPDIPIDSLEQPWSEIGKCAFERLIEKLNDPGENKRILIRPTLIKKGSVA
jgi:DNA-binding LacI/PurR family transcriptional regulator